MDIPVSFKLGLSVSVDELDEWLTANDMFDRITYAWISRVLTFDHEEDAVAFSITFGLSRYETTIDKMIKNEKSTD